MCWAREANIRASSAQGDKPGGAAIQQHLANFFAGGSAARLARVHDRDSLMPQHDGQFFQLRAFAAAVEAFEGDEAAFVRVRSHAEIIAKPGVSSHL